MNHDQDPVWEDYRIVCAAVKIKWGEFDGMLVGVRHFDMFMNEQLANIEMLNNIGARIRSQEIEGFITNKWDYSTNAHQFLTRTEAWKVAEAAGQIIRRCGGDYADGGTLYSENLY